MKPRSPRTQVHVPARMRSGTVWSDIDIKNMSCRGLMAETGEPPIPRSYVEVRRGTLVIVGRVVWAQGRKFGLHVQDDVDVDAIVNEPRLAARPRSSGNESESPAERRRDADRHHA